MRILAVIVVLGACSKSESVLPGEDVTRYSLGLPPDERAAVSFEIGGHPSKSGIVELPKDQIVRSVTLVYATPCGEKRVPVELVRSGHATDADAFEIEVPGDASPNRTYVHFDPRLAGAVQAGSLALKDKAVVYDLACVKSITVAGVEAPLPPTRHDDPSGLLVTARPEACFVSELVFYNADTPRPPDDRKLTGARVYWVEPSYTFEWRPAEKMMTNGREETKSSLNECPSL